MKSGLSFFWQSMARQTDGVHEHGPLSAVQVRQRFSGQAGQPLLAWGHCKQTNRVSQIGREVRMSKNMMQQFYFRTLHWRFSFSFRGERLPLGAKKMCGMQVTYGGKRAKLKTCGLMQELARMVTYAKYKTKCRIIL